MDLCLWSCTSYLQSLGQLIQPSYEPPCLHPWSETDSTCPASSAEQAWGSSDIKLICRHVYCQRNTSQAVSYSSLCISGATPVPGHQSKLNKCLSEEQPDSGHMLSESPSYPIDGNNKDKSTLASLWENRIQSVFWCKTTCKPYLDFHDIHFPWTVWSPLTWLSTGSGKFCDGTIFSTMFQTQDPCNRPCTLTSWTFLSEKEAEIQNLETIAILLAKKQPRKLLLS